MIDPTSSTKQRLYIGYDQCINVSFGSEELHTIRRVEKQVYHSITVVRIKLKQTASE